MKVALMIIGSGSFQRLVGFQGSAKIDLFWKSIATFLKRAKAQRDLQSLTTEQVSTSTVHPPWFFSNAWRITWHLDKSKLDLNFITAVVRIPTRTHVFFVSPGKSRNKHQQILLLMHLLILELGRINMFKMTPTSLPEQHHCLHHACCEVPNPFLEGGPPRRCCHLPWFQWKFVMKDGYKLIPGTTRLENIPAWSQDFFHQDS